MIEVLWRSGYIVHSKVGTIAGGTYKCNFDVEITMDVLKVVYQVKPDIIVLASGDSDFVPLIQDVRKAGVRVEVAAFEESAGTDMMSKCSGFVDLGVYYDTYLAARDGAHEETRIAEQFKDLIQAQEDEQGKDGTAELDRDLFHSRESHIDEGAATIVEKTERQTGMSAPDIMDELEL